MKHKYYLGLYIKKIQEQVSYTRNIFVGKKLYKKHFYEGFMTKS